MDGRLGQAVTAARIITPTSTTPGPRCRGLPRVVRRARRRRALAAAARARRLHEPAARGFASPSARCRFAPGLGDRRCHGALHARRPARRRHVPLRRRVSASARPPAAGTSSMTLQKVPDLLPGRPWPVPTARALHVRRGRIIVPYRAAAVQRIAAHRQRSARCSSGWPRPSPLREADPASRLRRWPLRLWSLCHVQLGASKLGVREDQVAREQAARRAARCERTARHAEPPPASRKGWRRATPPVPVAVQQDSATHRWLSKSTRQVRRWAPARSSTAPENHSPRRWATRPAVR